MYIHILHLGPSYYIPVIAGNFNWIMVYGIYFSWKLKYKYKTIMYKNDAMELNNFVFFCYRRCLKNSELANGRLEIIN